MTQKLVSIGNSRGVILNRKMIAEVGLDQVSQIEVTIEDGRIVIDPVSSDPEEAIRHRFKDADPAMFDAFLTMATKAARKKSIAAMKRRHG